MKRKIGILASLALTFAAVASSATAPGPAPTPACSIYLIQYVDGSSRICYCNFGTNCTPPTGIAHCTVAECSFPEG